MEISAPISPSDARRVFDQRLAALEEAWEIAWRKIDDHTLSVDERLDFLARAMEAQIDLEEFLRRMGVSANVDTLAAMQEASSPILH